MPKVGDLWRCKESGHHHLSGVGRGQFAEIVLELVEGRSEKPELDIRQSKVASFVMLQELVDARELRSIVRKIS